MGIKGIVMDWRDTDVDSTEYVDSAEYIDATDLDDLESLERFERTDSREQENGGRGKSNSFVMMLNVRSREDRERLVLL